MPTSPRKTDRTPRVLGGWEGRAWIADDFDAPIEELIRLFEGRLGATRSKRSTAAKSKRRS